MKDVSIPDQELIPTWLTFLLAAACGLIVANIYYSQPLVGPISTELGLSPSAAGLIVTLTQIGYGAGLLLVVPLGDLLENRRLVLVVAGIGTLAMLGLALSASALLFLAVSFWVGLGSVSVQILVPYAAHLVPEEVRGRIVGNVMSGLMIGIMMARPVASFIAGIASWRVVFFLAAGVMVVLIFVLRRALPPRHPHTNHSYGELLISMWHLALGTPILQRRTFYHSCMFGAFSLFWTTTPLLLASPVYHFSQMGIAWFSLAGVAGAIAAPLAGRAADGGWSRPATGIAMVGVVVAFLITHLAQPGSAVGLALLVVSGILLDSCVTTNMVLSQRAIFMLGAEHRNRLNGLYMATFFMGGAIGSATGAWAYAHGGWAFASCVGIAFPLLAFAYFTTEFRLPGKSED